MAVQKWPGPPAGSRVPGWVHFAILVGSLKPRGFGGCEVKTGDLTSGVERTLQPFPDHTLLPASCTS